MAKPPALGTSTQDGTSPSMLVLVGFVGACFLAAVTGAMFPPGDWYERLAKPLVASTKLAVRPDLDRHLPDHCRFRLDGMAQVRLRRRGPAACYLSSAIGAECCLDTLIFFGLRRPALAFFEIIMLWLSIVATIATFHSHSVAAAWLLLPYLAWVMFAAALNFTIWRLNRGSVP